MSPDSSVALIVAAKDAAATIGRAVASALAQPPVTEVIVVDDGSSDATAAVARACDDGSGRLTLLELRRNLGPAAARNRALAHTRAPVVGVLDADDHLEPGRIEALLRHAPAEWDLLADNLIMQAPADRGETRGLLIEPPVSEIVRVTAHDFIRGNLSDPLRPRRELGFLKPLMRRAFFERFDLAYDESLRLGEDYALYAEALIRGAAFFLTPACGYVAVERHTSLSGDHGVFELAALAQADRRLLDLAQGRPQVVRALRTHLRATEQKLDYRRALAAKKEGRIAAAFGHLFRTPATARYILGETLRAWTARGLR
jgi:succinoglycan biosynthesis protein ExoU